MEHSTQHLGNTKTSAKSKLVKIDTNWECLLHRLTTGSHDEGLEKEDAWYQEEGQGRPQEEGAERRCRCRQDVDPHPCRYLVEVKIQLGLTHCTKIACKSGMKKRYLLNFNFVKLNMHVRLSRANTKRIKIEFGKLWKINI